MDTAGELIFFCGKMGAGKSTFASQLAQTQNAVLLSEDAWLASLYPSQINELADYLHYSNQIKPLVHALVQNILRSGANVVMDFPANTAAQRQWFRALADSVSAAHTLIYIECSDAQCLRHIAKRRIVQPERAQFDTDAVFYKISAFFEAPSAVEGLNLSTVTPPETP